MAVSSIAFHVSHREIALANIGPLRISWNFYTTLRELLTGVG
jgi:hypothetical protein